jgi:hypothetical protein
MKKCNPSPKGLHRSVSNGKYGFIDRTGAVIDRTDNSSASIHSGAALAAVGNRDTNKGISTAPETFIWKQDKQLRIFHRRPFTDH